MGNTILNTYTFDKEGHFLLSANKRGKDWPVVYLIHNDKEMYIGETQNAYNRFEQHLKNQDRSGLKSIKIIFDDEFNKSAILDIEQSLIHLVSADNKYVLQNLNGGQSEKHNYYQREKYLSKIDLIWKKLLKMGLAVNPIEVVRNTDLFKFSPYNTLTSEQNDVCKEIINDIVDKLSTNTKSCSVIRGGAGTGKTILLINTICKLVTFNKYNIDFSEEDDELSENIQLIHRLLEFSKREGRQLKIGYVVPMTSMRSTLKKVFASIKCGLSAQMVIGPFDVFKDNYDIIFVDEAHRLAQYQNIGFRGEYKKCAEKLGKDPSEVTQLDMILANSKYTVLVYDKNQTVKKSDITLDQFNRALDNIHISEFFLRTQMRCKGGESYTDYIDEIFNCSCNDKKQLENYDFKIFDDADLMINRIKTLDKQYGLCRNASGYSWEWISKDCCSVEEAISNHKEDIEINGKKYVWNMTNKEFILSDNAINQIGCIHTLQGYDLNYIGLIFGREIDYDEAKNEIVINKDLYFDKYVKIGSSEKELKEFIINSYKVMMTRGIKGCYIYAYNKNLRKYLNRFVDKGE